MRARAYTASLALALVFAGCEEPAPIGDGPDASPPSLPLIAGAREVLRDDRGPVPAGDGGVFRPGLSLTDISHDGTRVAVLVTLEARTDDFALLLSDDGETFTTHLLGHINSYSAVHLAGGQVWLLGADPYGDPYVWRFDALVGQAVEPRAFVGPPYAFDGARVLSLGVGTQHGDGGAAHLVVFDGQRGEVTRVNGPGAPEGACLGDYSRRADGVWERWCYRVDRRCVIERSERSPQLTAVERCVDAEVWPVPQTVAQGAVLIDGRSWVAHFVDGRTAITRIEAGAVVGPIDLGPGLLSRIDYAELAHPRFDGLVVLGAMGRGGRPRYLQVDGVDVREIGLLGSPCADSGGCGGSSEFVALARLDAERWLAFHIVTLSETDRRLVVREARPDEGPPGAIDPSTLPELARRPTEPLLAVSPLERACAAASACFPRLRFEDCLIYWAEQHTLSEVEQRAFEAFIAAPHGDCEATAAAFPEVGVPWSNPGATGCFGDVAVSGPGAADCGLRGTTCRMEGEVPTCGDPAGASCDACDAQGRAVTCLSTVTPVVTDCAALGLDCVATPASEVDLPYAQCGAGTCTASGQRTCEGDALVTCYAGHKVVIERCDRLGLACSGGRCEQPGRTDVQGCSEADAPYCDGRYLVHCEGGGPRAVDCAAVGFETCVEDRGTRCSRAAPDR